MRWWMMWLGLALLGGCAYETDEPGQPREAVGAAQAHLETNAPQTGATGANGQQNGQNAPQSADNGPAPSNPGDTVECDPYEKPQPVPWRDKALGGPTPGDPSPEPNELGSELGQEIQTAR